MRLLGAAPSVPQLNFPGAETGAPREESARLLAAVSTRGASPRAPGTRVRLAWGLRPEAGGPGRQLTSPPVTLSQPRLNLLPLQPSLSYGCAGTQRRGKRHFDDGAAGGSKVSAVRGLRPVSPTAPHTGDSPGAGGVGGVTNIPEARLYLHGN